MSVDLPPPIPAEPVEISEIRRQGDDFVSVAVQKYQVHIIGPALVDRTGLADSLGAAVKLSEVVEIVRANYYKAGYPGTRVRYAAVDHDIYVQVIEDPIVRIEMAQPYASYFSGVAEKAPLTDAMIEPARTLASELADRTGSTAQLILAAESGGLALGLAQQPSDRSPLHFDAGFGNPGNRFLGRYFASAAASLDTRWGDSLRVSTTDVVRGLDGRSDGVSYGGYTLDWSRVTPAGIFGISGQTLRYRQELPATATGLAALLGFADPVELHGALDQVEASWATILAAGFDHRVGVTLKADYVDKRVHAENPESTVQSQEYPSLEAGLQFLKAVPLFDEKLQLSGGLSARKGLDGGRSPSPEQADLGYVLLRPSVRLEMSMDQGWGGSMSLSGQLSRDSVPEQQQFLGGGVGNLDGFLPGALIGDEGGLARLQVDAKTFRSGNFSLTPHAFVEVAGASLHATPLNSSEHSTLADAGISLDLSYRTWLTAAVSSAMPIAHHGYSSTELHNERSDIVFSLSAHL
ncbi:MAG: hypothetical protein JWQ90_4338 [Hydrocarboniphaga sp.]|uniref:ShlB/FhaC/HecB family hemolysin secretion/activation protein n=1 Tax=Hydrocarboniphaga sp. TaxID=2033016 RepID=UPI00260B677A|nr:ShlB/FhaC/HecB family hemolysin secretion/activation protein [Hydrocarboniphaga sp.]MDB5971888.1 hypothetical protein [Hydrocarboniphaga sp.]